MVSKSGKIVSKAKSKKSKRMYEKNGLALLQYN